MPALVIRHSESEHLGHFGPTAAKVLPGYQYADLYAAHPLIHPEPASFDSLIILGGAQSANDPLPYLQAEYRLIEGALRDRKPILGICLGAQMLARVLGATVRKNPAREIGWFPVTATPDASGDPLFASWATRVVFHWHQETFGIPSGAVRLAGSERCSNQAFRYGDRAWGLQFHPEATAEMIARWLQEDEACGADRESDGPVEPSAHDQSTVAAGLLSAWAMSRVE